MLKIILLYILVCLIYHSHLKKTSTKHWREIKMENLREKIGSPPNFEFIEGWNVPTHPRRGRRKVYLNITMQYTHLASEIIHWEHLANKPTLSWRYYNLTDYYTLFFTHTKPDYDAKGYYEYHNWIVVNILGIDVFGGDEIIGYSPPKLQLGAFRAIYKLIVYKQPGRMTFEEYGKSPSRTFTTYEKFAAKYNLGSPVAGWTLVTEDLRFYEPPTTTTMSTRTARRKGSPKPTSPTTTRIRYRTRRKRVKGVSYWPLKNRVRHERKYYGLSTTPPFC